MKKSENPEKNQKSKRKLNSNKILKLEKCMIKNNLKLTKTDISLAARKSRVPINKALFHFQLLKKELSDNKIEENKDLTKKVIEIKKKISRLCKKIDKRSE